MEFLNRKKTRCLRPGSNWGPCACEAHVITTTLQRPHTMECVPMEYPHIQHSTCCVYDQVRGFLIDRSCLYVESFSANILDALATFIENITQ